MGNCLGVEPAYMVYWILSGRDDDLVDQHLEECTMVTSCQSGGTTKNKNLPSRHPKKGEVWQKGISRREVVEVNSTCVAWKFPDITFEVKGSPRCSSVSLKTWHRWRIGDKRRGESPATCVYDPTHDTSIPDHEFAPVGRPTSGVGCEQREETGPQAEWDDPHEKTDDEYEGRHEEGDSIRRVIAGCEAYLAGVEVHEDDGEE